jgi:hypothetical protein
LESQHTNAARSSTASSSSRASGRFAPAAQTSAPAQPRSDAAFWLVAADGTRVPVEAAGRPLGSDDDRLVIIARDITDRVAQERELRRVLEVEQAARRASEAAHARVRLLADASALLERWLSGDDALQQVAELLVARVADACALDIVDLAAGVRRAAADARFPDGRRRLMAMAGDPRVARALETVSGAELVEVADGVARVRLGRNCSGAAVEQAVLRAAPELERVEPVVESKLLQIGSLR